MNRTLSLQELAIVVSTPNQNPSVINLEFLKYSGIVPMDWELARAPIATNQVSQIVFTNGVAVAAQTDRIMFLEAINNKADTEILVAGVAQKYTAVMQRMEYQAVGINLRGYVEQDNEDAPREYLTKTLLAPGSWQEFGQDPVRATLNLAYTLPEGKLSISVNDATLQLPEEESKPVILFSGNFSYDMSELDDIAKAEKMNHLIGNWQSDVDSFRDLINTKFLMHATDTVVAVPNLFAAASV
jgi:hypothetical protein